MLAILRDRRVGMSALAAYLGLDKSTMSGPVDRAERRGLLARAPNPSDGRAVDVALSPTGAELTDSLYVRVVHELSPMTDRLPRAEQRRLQTLLRRLVRPEES